MLTINDMPVKNSYMNKTSKNGSKIFLIGEAVRDLFKIWRSSCQRYNSEI